MDNDQQQQNLRQKQPEQQQLQPQQEEQQQRQSMYTGYGRPITLTPSQLYQREGGEDPSGRSLVSVGSSSSYPTPASSSHHSTRSYIRKSQLNKDRSPLRIPQEPPGVSDDEDAASDSFTNFEDDIDLDAEKAVSYYDKRRKGKTNRRGIEQPRDANPYSNENASAASAYDSKYQEDKSGSQSDSGNIDNEQDDLTEYEMDIGSIDNEQDDLTEYEMDILYDEGGGEGDGAFDATTTTTRRRYQRRILLVMLLLLGVCIITAVILGAILGVLIDRENEDDTSPAVQQRSGPSEAPSGPIATIPTPAPIPPTISPVSPTSSPSTPNVITDQALFDLISAASWWDDGAAILIPDSPQQKAFLWLQSEDTVVNSVSDPRKIQRYALATFFHSTNGPTSWIRKTNWLSRTVSECLWYVDEPDGIGCTSDQQVRNLEFVDNQLTGGLVPELALLTELQVLVINNQGNAAGVGGMTKGGIPNELRSLSSLVFVQINGNDLSQGAPLADNLFDLWSNALLVDFSHNNLPGSLPSSVRFLKSVTALLMNNNKLQGPIPEDIEGMVRITQLSLHHNNFNGSIPAQLTTLTTIRGLFLQNNKLKGPLPSFSTLTALSTGLDLSDNEFGGAPLPTNAFDNLSQLRVLRLSNAEIAGPLPDLSSSSGLSSGVLKDLYLENNPGLTGVVPESVCQSVSAQGGDGVVDCLLVQCSCCCAPSN